ncbi:PstS family phosphate ABC transporter substrate-binding protein [Actinokineospora globicatena]|uniref:PstS family phosphate ABC transporter substrate-binding protein n=1 Tax=Actinokineospora globicatena TaxID=103729 RepID=UPI0020A28765|nr:substrate-binding domain-containing protein [Actinokineospora globicatena]MCP2302319.1 phosphate transport system substrate-binding protein [Actinokineospora globicatena]GLW76011.1 phosphate ABC transporter substrate-binding protein [Actinokineospora globicatena]GLW82849.1 phosphate ABC transporter substrate-binding protein [Actinokineospora globicatena]
MTELRDALRAVLDFLGAGNLVLGIVLLVATPFVDRFLIRRKRVSFRVHYNSKIGLGPEKLTDETSDSGQLTRLTRLLDRLSIVVIRIRNTGGYDIDPDDFDRPLTFTFGERVVWNARISEAGSAEVREKLRAGLRFFRTDGTDSANGTNGQVGPPVADERDSLRTVRDKMAQRMVRWIGGQAPAPKEPEAEPRWHGVRLETLALKRKQKIKLVVVLEEPEDHPGGETSKEITATGKLADNGIIKDEKRQRRFTLPRLTGALALVLTAFLVLSLVFASPPDDPSVRCVSGDITIRGSSVFMPTMKAMAADYTAACADATITTQATGSIDGVRWLASADPATSAALSDGLQQNPGGLVAQQLAVVVYHVVVHAGVPVETLSTEDLRRIYDGTYTDWNQVSPGSPSLPIRIVGRGQSSGTRQLFEKQVLNGGEGGLSSDECVEKNRDPRARTTRCERESNSDVVAMIGAVAGAIGYADAPSVAEARKKGDLKAVSIDGKTFDTAAGLASNYPFWTVEHLYLKGEPGADSLLAAFAEHVRKHDSARLRLKDSGYLPCVTPEGTPLELCSTR